jgi:hypothetical protein
MCSKISILCLDLSNHISFAKKPQTIRIKVVLLPIFHESFWTMRTISLNSILFRILIYTPVARKVKLLYDWRSVSMSWYRAPLWDLRPDITSCRNVVWNLRSFFCRVPSLARGRVAICSVITKWSESLRTRNCTLQSHLRLPQPGGQGSRIYIPQEQGGPVIPPGTGFRLRRFLRLAGLRWRYSNPLPTWRNRLSQMSKSKIKVTLRPMASQSSCLGS